MKKSVTAIVLAAGQSSRMDEYKLTKLLCGEPVLAYVLKTLKKVDFSDVIVVYERDEVKALAKCYGFRAVQNKESYLGQSSSIVIGTKNANECDGFIYIIGDQPFISEVTLQNMISTFNNNPDFFIAAAVDGKRCSPVLFPYAYRADLESLTGDTGGRPILKANAEKILLCRCDPMEAFDLDTVSDFNVATDYLMGKS